MPKFFTNENDIIKEEKKIYLDEETSHHVANVLRYKEGDDITVTSQMIDYLCKIKKIDKKIELEILNEKENSAEFPFEINLYQGIAKGDKMDSIIQKATELGVTNIIPVETKYTVVKLIGDDKLNKKIDRWNKISYEASKQSERGIVPTVKNPIKLKDAIKEIEDNNSTAMVCYGRCDNYNVKQFFKDHNITKENINNIKSISFFIGPEGGFDIEEINTLNEHGIEAVSLGDRILRTETASSVLLSMLTYELF